MKKTINLIIILTCTSFFLNAQTEIVPNTTDARSYGMGKTSIMSAKGSNAIFSNPALLFNLTNKQLQLGGRVTYGIITQDYNKDEYEKFEAKYNLHPKLDHISFAMPYNFSNTDLKFVFGAGYHSYYDFGKKAYLEYRYKDYDKTYEEKLQTGGGLNELVFSGALNYQDKYFVGLSINKSIFSTIKSNYEFKHKDYSESEEESTETSASSYLIGGLAKITPKISVGFSYHSKFTWKFKDTKWETKDNDGDKKKGDYENDDIDVPVLYGIGVEYQFSPSILIVGEYQNRPFSDYEKGSKSLFGNLDDGANYRLGIEFQESSPIYRLGVFNDVLPTADSGDDKPKTLLGITGGTEFMFNNIIVDAYLEYSKWGREIKKSRKTYDYSENLFRFGVSIKYNFESHSTSKEINTEFD